MRACRGDKLSHYQQLDSLRAVLFVSHRSPRITVVSRTGATWSEHEFHGGETVSIPVHNAMFSVNDVYDGIALDVA